MPRQLSKRAEEHAIGRVCRGKGTQRDKDRAPCGQVEARPSVERVEPRMMIAADGQECGQIPITLRHLETEGRPEKRNRRVQFGHREMKMANSKEWLNGQRPTLSKTQSVKGELRHVTCPFPELIGQNLDHVHVGSYSVRTSYFAHLSRARQLETSLRRALGA